MRVPHKHSDIVHLKASIFLLFLGLYLSYLMPVVQTCTIICWKMKNYVDLHKTNAWFHLRANTNVLFNIARLEVGQN